MVVSVTEFEKAVDKARFDQAVQKIEGIIDYELMTYARSFQCQKDAILKNNNGKLFIQDIDDKKNAIGKILTTFDKHSCDEIIKRVIKDYSNAGWIIQKNHGLDKDRDEHDMLVIDYPQTDSKCMQSNDDSAEKTFDYQKSINKYTDKMIAQIENYIYEAKQDIDETIHFANTHNGWAIVKSPQQVMQDYPFNERILGAHDIFERVAKHFEKLGYKIKFAPFDHGAKEGFVNTLLMMSWDISK